MISKSKKEFEGYDYTYFNKHYENYYFLKHLPVFIGMTLKRELLTKQKRTHKMVNKAVGECKGDK